MKATTFKIENPLLNELHALKPREQKFSTFVRELLEKAVRRHRMAQSAERYADFLKSNPDEAAWLAEWEGTDLAHPVKTRAAKGKA